MSPPTTPIGRRCFLVSLAAAAAGTRRRQSDPQPEPGEIERASTSLAAWLSAAGLDETLATARLRHARRPDRTDESWLQWDLRFITVGTKVDEELRRFLHFVGSPHGPFGRAGAEALFYKLLHESGRRRTAIGVVVLVLDRTFLIDWDTDRGELRLQEEASRNVRRVVDLGPSLRSNQRASVRLTGRDQGLPASIQQFLRDYFANASTARVQLLPLEADFAGVNVEGIRARVLRDKRYWERLQISIEIKDASTSPRAVCYIDGQYAAGLGNRPPGATSYSDMQSRFGAELVAFADAMLRELQAHLSR